jgi:hypothetical protein
MHPQHSRPVDEGKNQPLGFHPSSLVQLAPDVSPQVALSLAMTRLAVLQCSNEMQKDLDQMAF